MTLNKIVQTLQNLLKEEHLKCDYQNWTGSMISAESKDNDSVPFPKILEIMAKYITAPILDEEKLEMRHAMCYHVMQLDFKSLSEVSEKLEKQM